MVFVFLDASDVEKVMMGELWTFNKHLVSLQKVEKHTDVRRLEFVSTRFWVQVHDLPIGLNSSVVKDIVLVVCIVVDSGSELEGCNFQRFRVVMFPNQFFRGQKITLHSRKYC